MIGNQDLISEPIGIGYIPQKLLNSMQRKDFSTTNGQAQWLRGELSGLVARLSAPEAQWLSDETQWLSDKTEF